MDNQSFTLAKSSVELYRFRHTSGHYWADITIDANGEAGRISIASDFGDWSNYWGCCGMPFKDFLSKIDIGYASNKFGANDFFDVDKNIAALNKEVELQLLDDVINAELAEKMKEEISGLRDFNSKDAFAVQCFNADHLHQLWDCGPDLITVIEPGFKHFWDKIWPEMIKAFQSEEKEVVNG